VIPQQRQIGPYRVVERIKDGSVGTVWKVADVQNKVFALKLISENNSKRPHKVKQFRKEARLGQRLEHANIVKVYEYDSNGGRPYFVMDFFHSENLKYCLTNQPERVNGREFFILRQVADAMAYIHAQRIVHKDLKPENILVNDRAEARLIDLSLAQEKWDGFLGIGRTVGGTPSYMAPEQILNKKLDSRTDIYAFGAVAYETVAKRPVFFANSQNELFKKHIQEPPAPLRHTVQGINPALEAMILRCLEKNPAQRWQDMTQILYELGRWEKQDTVARKQQVAEAESGPNAAQH
jgi:serine/threonine protein kinase